jgi:hypothetical protein
MIFTVSIRLHNDDVHNFNIKALSFKNAHNKVDLYCAFLACKYPTLGSDYKSCKISGDLSSDFISDLAFIKITPSTINGYPIITGGISLCEVL